MRIWHGANGGVLSLAEMDSGFWFSASESEIRDMARQVAGDRQGGLIELKTFHRANNNAVRFIYKQLQGLAYFFTGMFIVRTADGPVMWTIADGERGATGLREAVVTGRLIKSAALKTREDIENFLAPDPYDVASLGVDSRVRCFASDNEQYDPLFPDHPLSNVRRVLDDLCTWAQFSTPTHEGTIQ